MSAFVAVRTAKAIHMLSDGASTSMRDDATYGLMLEVRSKQVVANGVAFACCQYLEPTIRFAELAAEQCAGYDDVVWSDRRLFAEAVKTLGRWQNQFCGVFYGGWSARKKRLSMSKTYSDPSYHRQFRHRHDIPAMAVGPAPPACELGDEFVKRFTADPDSFEPHRDGLRLLETMRAQCRCEDYGRSYFAIGAYVQLTTITPDEITTAVIHHWPDEIGKRVEPGAEPGAVTSTGMPWRDVYRRREEALIEQQSGFFARIRLRGVPDGAMILNPNRQAAQG